MCTQIEQILGVLSRDSGEKCVFYFLRAMQVEPAFLGQKCKLLANLVHRAPDECRCPAELCGARGVVAEHLAELAGAGEPGE